MFCLMKIKKFLPGIDVTDLIDNVDNWGIFKGKPVVIGYGFDKEVKRKFYW